MHPLDWIDDELGQLDRCGLRRRRATVSGPAGPRVVLDGRDLVHFGSNDYLGLAGDPRLAAAAARAATESGWGSGASPLISGRSAWHARLEAELARFEGSEGALLFASGFAANAGTIPALVERGDAIFADAKNHASLIDGCRLSRADVYVYPHADAAALAELLTRYAPAARRRLIVTDGLFSMDGDVAPLDALADLAERHAAMLLVDEAHATGVFGARGRGTCEARGVEDRVHVRIGTLSKALGCSGGFVAGPSKLIDWLANRARSYVFSTAQPAATAAAALAALEIVAAEPARRLELLARAEALREALRTGGWTTGCGDGGCGEGDVASQIIPLRIGDAEQTMQLAARLREAGHFVPGIRPPSVPEGESLLRLSLTAAHTEEMVANLLRDLARLRQVSQ